MGKALRAALSAGAAGAVLFAASESLAGDLFRRIDAAHRAGQLDEAERRLYRALAVRAPERLPDGLRVDSSARAPACVTHALLEAFQYRDQLPAAQRKALDLLLEPPPGLPLQVESSSPFPVRVYYSQPSQQAYAERILKAVAISFERQVTEWGFWTPLIEQDGEPYRIYVDQTPAGAAAYTAPYLANHATPHEDSFTYVVVSPSLDDVFLDLTIAHEFNHACQAAMDMAEPAAFFENTATYVESLVFPAGAQSTLAMYRAFQAKPYLPLEYAPFGVSDGYEYGAALWLSFLVHVHGQGDPRWIRELWEGSVQAGPINEPDHRDVLTDRLGGPAALRAAIEEFGRHRFFVGANDDGAHLPAAGQWKGAEVWLAAAWTEAQLPIRDRAPDASTQPRPSGCNYVTLTAAPASKPPAPLRYTFDGDPELPWAVSVLKLSGETGSSYELMPLDARAHGSLSISTDGLDQTVLVVCQSLADGYELDAKQWTPGDYRYSIEYDIPPPSIGNIEPASVPRGADGFAVTIRGHGFYAGEELSVKISGSTSAVTAVQFVSPEQLRVTLAIASSAELGPRNLTVTNPGGGAVTAPAALEIVESELVGAPAGSEGDGGCGCRSAVADDSSALSALVLLALLASLARRRSPRC